MEESKEKREREEVSVALSTKNPALKHFSIGCCREKRQSANKKAGEDKKKSRKKKKKKGENIRSEEEKQEKGRTAIKDRASDTPNHESFEITLKDIFTEYE